jgi:hypothetical protein
VAWYLSRTRHKKAPLRNEGSRSKADRISFGARELDP